MCSIVADGNQKAGNEAIDFSDAEIIGIFPEETHFGRIHRQDANTSCIIHG
jgi:hypothetical protein